MQALIFYMTSSYSCKKPKGVFMEFFEDFSMEFFKEAIERCFPQITVTNMQRNDEGWDHCVFLVNNMWIFRVPRHSEAAQRLTLESRLLPELHKVVDIPIPHFELVSPGYPGFERPFVGYRRINGVPLTPTLLAQLHSPGLSPKIANQIATFLSALHQFPVKKAMKMGVLYQKKKESLSTFFDAIQQKVFPLLNSQEQDWTKTLFESVLKNNQLFEYVPVLLHGDFSFDHILFNRSREIIGIIDFGDVSIGDSASDFACVLDYGTEFDHWVLKGYQGKIDHTFFQRRAFYHDCIAFWEILGGIEHKNPKYLESGLKRLKTTIPRKSLMR